MNKQIKIGEIGIDAGLVWIGDPCYILHKTENEQPKSIGKNWSDFCDILKKGKQLETGFLQFCYDKGHAGLGVCASTGWGDGCYDVMAEIKDNRIKSISIKFF